MQLSCKHVGNASKTPRDSLYINHTIKTIGGLIHALYTWETLIFLLQHHISHSALLQVILDVLNFGRELSEAVPYPRLHHQLYPDYIRVEKDFPQEYVEGLKERGHEIVESSTYAVVQGIIRSGGYIHATSDPRKGGKPDGF